MTKGFSYIRLILLTAILMQLFMVSCIDRKPIPTDEAMTAHFKANEATLCELQNSLLNFKSFKAFL